MSLLAAAVAKRPAHVFQTEKAGRCGLAQAVMVQRSVRKHVHLSASWTLVHHCVVFGLGAKILHFLPAVSADMMSVPFAAAGLGCFLFFQYLLLFHGFFLLQWFHFVPPGYLSGMFIVFPLKYTPSPEKSTGPKRLIRIAN